MNGLSKFILSECMYTTATGNEVSYYEVYT